MFTYRRWPALLVGICWGICLLLPTVVEAQTSQRAARIAVLDFAEAGVGKVASARLATTLASIPELAIVDRDLSRAAARGTGYSGSLNLAVVEARDLGAAIGCDFYLIGDSQTVRRSPSTGPVFFESYASIFLVSARTGKLISWERPSFEAATAGAADQLLLGQLGKDETGRRYLNAVRTAKEKERHAREIALEQNTPIIEETADEPSSDGQSFRPPRPYRRLKPEYPDTAARADAEGTVDVLVDLDKEGEVSRVDVARWAGFGLDEVTVDTVRQLHFFPARRDGVATPTRVLLRYNFRRPTKK